ncbi:hypothetical protein SO802_029553 [Lithocarpus litseifolius]|uniref:Homing endonuclease LAGLIDADG domain-containing protein n=1 Tax=Lithocarpus litseifolius TaxID=425828 RepID=A0AAW2BWZ1_9ROSI
MVATLEAWKHPDFLCKNYILNGLDNTLYNVYSSIKSAKVLWDSLDKKYKTKDVGTKKLIMGKLLDYKMVDSKTVLSQVILNGNALSESFQVAAIIKKLPLSWKDFKNYLKYKHKEIWLENLIVRLRIEEDNRSSENAIRNHYMESKANIVEHNKNKRKLKARIKEPMVVILQSNGICYIAMCVARWDIVLRTAISIKIKGPRKALKPTLLK